MPRITARGAPSVGLGQNTDTSKAESTSGTSAPGVGMMWARPSRGAASSRSSGSVSPLPARIRCTRSSSSSRTARTTTSLRFLKWKREMQPTTNASWGMPSSPRTRARPSSL